MKTKKKRKPRLRWYRVTILGVLTVVVQAENKFAAPFAAYRKLMDDKGPVTYNIFPRFKGS